MKINQFATAALSLMLIGGTLVAQQTVPGQPTTTNPPTGQAQQNQGQAVQPASGQRAVAGSTQSKDQTFAKLLEITNKEQVSIARFAQENATRDEVKAFAKTLEEEHQSCVDELKGIASKIQTPGATGSTSPQRADGTGQQRSDNTSPQRADNLASTSGSQRAGYNSSNVDFLELHQEMSEQCLKDSIAWLNEKEGIEIDTCFVGMQVAKHAGMKSSLTVLERHATGELQNLIRKGLEKNEQHLQAAVKLMEKLSDSDSSKAVTTSAK